MFVVENAMVDIVVDEVIVKMGVVIGINKGRVREV